jgi:hypothetical protein
MFKSVVRIWISAINCKKSIKGLIKGPNPELSTLLYNHLLKIFSFQRAYILKICCLGKICCIKT